MKIKSNVFKAALTVAMAFVLLFPCFMFKASAAGYKAGDVVAFGSYPQSRVTDEKLIGNLNSLSLSWVSYGYYYGTTHGEDGEMCPGDFMKYADSEYDGKKYRAVIFDAYRPDETTGRASTDENDLKTYKIGTVYWFSYEPVEWIVLDAESGLVLSRLILDAQPFNNYSIMNPDNYNSETGSNALCYFGNPDMTYYSSDYVNSSVRKWLTTDFLETTFSQDENADIFTSTLDNTGYYTLNSYSDGEIFDFEKTKDKIFLLSYADVFTGDIFASGADREKLKKHYFDGDSSVFENAAGTDYAECQGLAKLQNKESASYGLSTWLLRTALHSRLISSVGGDSNLETVRTDDSGIRPAMKINLNSKNIIAVDSKKGGASDKCVYAAIAAGAVLAAGAGIAVAVILKKKKNK